MHHIPLAQPVAMIVIDVFATVCAPRTHPGQATSSACPMRRCPGPKFESIARIARF